MSDEQAAGAGGDAMARLEAALNAWENQLHDMHEHIASQLSQAHERLDRLIDSEANGSAGLVQQRDAEIELLQTRLTEAERIAAAAANRAQAADSEKERIAAENGDLRAANDALCNELDELRQQNARIAAERDSAAAECGAACAGRDAVRAECERLQAELSAARAQWENQPQATHEEIEEAKQNAEEHARRHGAAAMERDRLSEELEALRSRHSHVCGLKQEVEAECVLLRRRVRELEEAAISAAPGASTDETEETAPETDPFKKACATGAGIKKKLGEILVDAGVISPEQLEEVLGKQSRTDRRRLGIILIEHGYTNEDAIARAFAAQIQMPFTTLTDDEVDSKAAALLPAKIARMHHCVPVREEEGLLSVAMANPLDLVAIEDIELATKCLVFPLVATSAAIDFMVTRHCR